ncbi:hypothetical protein [Acinetobacter sp.]|uniref:hypothetical protein n=1 Tax=Acinetobacter sp. TaxID=472 RepID=UPI003D0635C4
MIKNFVKIWPAISGVAYTVILAALIFSFESPAFTNALDMFTYMVSRLIIAVIIQLGVLIIYQAHPSVVYRSMLEHFDNHEIQRLEEMPERFDRLAARTLLMLDVIWARENLLHSPLMFTRISSVNDEVAALRKSYNEFVHTYSLSLLEAFKAYSYPTAMRFIDKYGDNLELFYNELMHLDSKPFLKLSKRREHILEAFFNFYDAMLEELDTLEE